MGEARISGQMVWSWNPACSGLPVPRPWQCLSRNVGISGVGSKGGGWSVPDYAVSFLDARDIGPNFEDFAGDVGAKDVGVVLDVEALEEVSGTVAKCCAVQSLVPVS